MPSLTVGLLLSYSLLSPVLLKLASMASRRLCIRWIVSSILVMVMASSKVNSVVVAMGVALMLVGDAVVGVASDVAAMSGLW